MEPRWIEFQERLKQLTRQNGLRLRVFDSGNGYDISYQIGVSVKDSGDPLPVHRAKKLSPRNEFIAEVALQFCWNGGESSRRGGGIEVSHSNILSLQNDFITPNNIHVGVYPLMTFSMRGLLNVIYQRGMSEDLIAVVLGEALKGLNYLHEEHSEYIYNLNSNTVYCQLENPASIKIGYGCAIFEQFWSAHPKMHENHLDLSKICKWGCAPEIENDYSRYSTKCETWLVGLLGLDLYLGGIRARSRDDHLMDLIERVLGQRKGMASEDGWKLSRSFLDFERKCLNKNHLQRPSAQDLLKHQFIGDSKGLDFFTQWVQKALHQGIKRHKEVKEQIVNSSNKNS